MASPRTVSVKVHPQPKFVVLGRARDDRGQINNIKFKGLTEQAASDLVCELAARPDVLFAQILTQDSYERSTEPMQEVR